MGFSLKKDKLNVLVLTIFGLYHLHIKLPERKPKQTIICDWAFITNVSTNHVTILTVFKG